MLPDFPWDLMTYVFLAQVLPLAAWVDGRTRDQGFELKLITAQCVLAIGIMLTWGGYSVDAWRYLTGFDGSFLAYDKEWLYWSSGYLLNKLASDPWPLKILSALGVAIICLAIVRCFKPVEPRYCLMAVYVLLMVPAFYILFGNAVRQGLAGALVVFGLVSLGQGRRTVFAFTALAAFFVHQVSLVLVVAGLLARRIPRHAPWVLACTPFVSFLAVWIGNACGLDLAEYLHYADAEEGQFHWAKFLIAYPIAGASVVLATKKEVRIPGLLYAYVYMVAFSALLLKYEVPFERLLAYSEFLLPFVVVLWIDTLDLSDRTILRLWGVGIVGNALLLSHPSIAVTLGY